MAVLLCRSYWLGASFDSATDVEGVRISSVHEDGPAAAAGLDIGDLVFAVEGASGLRSAVVSSDVIVDPGLMSTYSEYRRFFTRQAMFQEIQSTGSVTFILADGERIAVDVPPLRPLRSLPWTFWYQIICASIAVMAGAIVAAFQRNNPATRYYSFTGLGIALVIYTNAFFSSRELSVDREVFYALSKINWLGVCLLGWGLICTLWYYPRRLANFPLGPRMSVIFIAALLWDWLEIPESLEVGQRIPLYIGFVVTVLVAWLQWRRQSHDPVSRAAMRWFFLSWFTGTGAFIFLILIPVTFNTRWGVDYVTAIGFLPVLQIGIALGILRYRLFDLDRWAMRIWLWFIGGSLVILMDAILIYLLNMNASLSLSISLLVIGWLYFPLRQFVWSRVGWSPLKADFQQIFPGLLRSVLNVKSDENISERWQSLLRDLYQPLSITELEDSPERVRRSESGLNMLIPAFPGSPPLMLSGASRGGRLMGPDDERFIESLWQLHSSAEGFRHAFEQGVAKERERVARDLHDDIASDLLGLIYLAPDAESRERAQNAFQELRVVIQGMENTTLPLLSNIESWGSDAEARCRAANITLHWQLGGDLDVHLPSRLVVNLRRAFREAVSNTIKHSQATEVKVSIFRQADDLLLVTITDNGTGMDGHSPIGRGLGNIMKRLEELGGRAEWMTVDDGAGHGTKLVMELPLVFEAGVFVGSRNMDTSGKGGTHEG